jgi:hypothetical protein
VLREEAKASGKTAEVRLPHRQFRRLRTMLCEANSISVPSTPSPFPCGAGDREDGDGPPAEVLQGLGVAGTGVHDWGGGWQRGRCECLPFHVVYMHQPHTRARSRSVCGHGIVVFVYLGSRVCVWKSELPNDRCTRLSTWRVRTSPPPPPAPTPFLLPSGFEAGSRRSGCEDGCGVGLCAGQVRRDGAG